VKSIPSLKNLLINSLLISLVESTIIFWYSQVFLLHGMSLFRHNSML